MAAQALASLVRHRGFWDVWGLAGFRVLGLSNDPPLDRVPKLPGPWALRLNFRMRDTSAHVRTSDELRPRDLVVLDRTCRWERRDMACLLVATVHPIVFAAAF